jgi:hypothetical protein
MVSIALVMLPPLFARLATLAMVEPQVRGGFDNHFDSQGPARSPGKQRTGPRALERGPVATGLNLRHPTRLY